MTSSAADRVFQLEENLHPRDKDQVTMIQSFLVVSIIFRYSPQMWRTSQEISINGAINSSVMLNQDHLTLESRSLRVQGKLNFCKYHRAKRVQVDKLILLLEWQQLLRRSQIYKRDMEVAKVHLRLTRSVNKIFNSTTIHLQ